MRVGKKGIARDLHGWMFLGPVVIGTLIFNVLPILPAIGFSLTDYTGLGQGRWVGLRNYIELFQDPFFYASLLRTLVYTLGVVLLAYAAGLALALLVNNAIRGVRFYRMLFFAPVVTSSVAIGMAWRWLLNTQFGLVNSALSSLGILGPEWLGDRVWAMTSIVIVTVWYRMGYNMILLLGGLQSIPDSLYESADIDGATWWRKFRSVTFPMLSPVTFFVMVLGMINAFISFDIIYILTRGGPGNATAVYVFRLWIEAFKNFRMAYASAMAWVLFMIIAMVTVFQWRMAKRWVFYR
jgi:multiple sugar transport system permease protein